MERADAARNRRAILRATEELLATHDLSEVSMDRVATAAGVGKGTVFHRFGNREGLMRALVESRVQELSAAVSSAFFDAVIELASKNVKVMAAFEQASTDRLSSPIYLSWHAHVSGLIASASPSLDADLIAHLLLGSLHSDLMLRFLKTGETNRLAAGLRSMVSTLLR
jgi:AcrR family transcriptional regulator